MHQGNKQYISELKWVKTLYIIRGDQKALDLYLMKAIFLSLLGLFYFVIYLRFLTCNWVLASVFISKSYSKVNSQLKFYTIFAITNWNLNICEVNCVRNWCCNFITTECSQVRRETDVTFVSNPTFIVFLSPCPHCSDFWVTPRRSILKKSTLSFCPFAPYCSSPFLY